MALSIQNKSDLKDNASLYYNDVAATPDYIKHSLAVAGLVTAGATGFALKNNGINALALLSPMGQPGLRSFMHKFIGDYASSKNINISARVLDTIRQELNAKNKSTLDKAIELALGDAIKNARATPLPDMNRSFDLIYTLNNLDKVRTLATKNQQQANIEAIDNVIQERLLKTFNYDNTAQNKLLNAIGWRQATVQDLLNYDATLTEGLKPLLSEEARINIANLVNQANIDYSDIIVDRNVLIDADNIIVNLKTPLKSLRDVLKGFVDDFQIPIIGFNPLKLFHIDRALADQPDIVRTFGSGEIQSILTGNAQSIGAKFGADGAPNLDKAFMFAGGAVYDQAGNVVVKRASLISNIAGKDMIAPGISGSKSFIAKDLATMMNLETTTFKPRYDTDAGKAMYNIFNKLGLGFQENRWFTEQKDFKLYDYTTWGDAIGRFADKFSPIEATPGDISKLFGVDAAGHGVKTILMRDSFKIGEDGFIRQFFAGRRDTDYITKATFVPYRIMARINESLANAGLGLPNADMGSTQAIFGNLLLKRVLPVAVAVGAATWINQQIKKSTGKTGEAHVRKTQAIADINLTGIKDTLGMTKFLKRAKQLMPGYEYVEEMPIIGKPFKTESKEEREEYWESGYDPVRKGRFFTLGNTPFTGGRIQRFKPNPKILAESNYKFTDTMYGDSDEYFKNYFLPNPTSPLAPIRHFLTDPYHYEQKHYHDRPYPLTGGIQEFNDTVIVGGFLNQTLGRLLKPQKKMHEEYWDGDRLRSAEEIKALKPQYPYLDIISGKPIVKAGQAGLYPAFGKDLPKQDPNAYYNTIAYIAPGGDIDVMIKPRFSNINNIQQLLKEKSVRRIHDLAKIPKGESPYVLSDEEKHEQAIKAGSIKSDLYEAFREASNMAGFYGYALEAFVPGVNTIERPKRIQSSQNMMSLTRSFWESDIGDITGMYSGIGSRFLPRSFKGTQYNPIRNRMPEYLPGDNYFLNFKYGDPYTLIKEGEYRLPGEGYEALHKLDDPMKMRLGASQIGGTKEEIIKQLLHISPLELSRNEELQEIAKKGTKYHEIAEKQMERIGLAVESKIYVRDDDLGISGYIDSILIDPSSPTGYAISDIKTVTSKKFQTIKNMYEAGASPYEMAAAVPSIEKNIKQVQFYMYNTGQEKGYLHFVDRDALDEGRQEAITIGFNYDKELMQETIDNIQGARDIIRQGIESGAFYRGDLYEPWERFKILADVAPYSDEYRYYRSYISQFGFDHPNKPEEMKQRRKEYSEIINRVSQLKKPLRFFDYRFKTANLTHEEVTVKGLTSRGAILTEEYGSNPIKLAGIDFSVAKDKPEAMDYLQEQLQPGQKIRIGYTADDMNKINSDTYRTISATIEANNKQLNREMLRQELATEREDDYSPASVHARFNAAERAFGRTWETIAHFDTFTNTKLMQVRSPLEMYKRKDLYGKDWQSWDNPIRDFLQPSIESRMSKGAVTGMITGGILGAAFGGSVLGKSIGGTVGAILGLSLGGYVDIKQAVTGEAWIPERRQRERNINEYIDTLNYVKNKRLYGQYRQAAIEHEGYDPEEFVRSAKLQGKERQQEVYRLEGFKRDFMTEQINEDQLREHVGFDGEGKELLRAINQRIAALKSDRTAVNIGPYTAQALAFNQEAEATLYAYKPGGNLQNVLTSLNRKERQYFMPFVKAPEKERKEILRLVPSYMRRPLQGAWGMPIDEKPDLETYFETHTLPDEDWAGWRPDVDLKDVKVKLVQHEAMDISEFDIWSDDVERADELDVPTPKLNNKQDKTAVRSKLYALLSNNNYDNIDIEISDSNYDQNDMRIQIAYDRREELEKYVREHGVI